MTGATSATAGAKEPPQWWPRGEVFVPERLFKKDATEALDQVIHAANPRLYLYPDFDPAAEHILVIGMPGWGGRSENFIWILINGLEDSGLTSRLIIAGLQDPKTGGPRYQGQGDRAHANVWRVDNDTVAATRRFVARIGSAAGKVDVYFFGFSSGGIAAPVLATRIEGLRPNPHYDVKGAICMGTGSRVPAGTLKAREQRVLFLVVPERRPEDPKPMRDDQHNRRVAELSQARMEQDGATSYLRHIESARRHIDWHWGLVSQCRYFRTARLDDGRGYWPNYWKPNPETTAHIRAFLRGEAPPEKLDLKPQDCPY